MGCHPPWGNREQRGQGQGIQMPGRARGRDHRPDPPGRAGSPGDEAFLPVAAPIKPQNCWFRRLSELVGAWGGWALPHPGSVPAPVVAPKGPKPPTHGRVPKVGLPPARGHGGGKPGLARVGFVRLVLRFLPEQPVKVAQGAEHPGCGRGCQLTPGCWGGVRADSLPCTHGDGDTGLRPAKNHVPPTHTLRCPKGKFP